MIIDIQTVDNPDGKGFELCIFPNESRRKRSDWIMWIRKDGSASVYVGRAENGALLSDPINLPPLVSRKKV